MTNVTVEQIAKVLAAHGWPMRGTRCRCGADLGIERPETLDRHQAEQVAALGVGDGEVEWGRAFRQGDGTLFVDDDEGAFRDAEDVQQFTRPGNPESPYDLVVRRTVGPWVEVTDEGGEG